MTNGHPCHPLLGRGNSALDHALLDLHSAAEMRDFWDKTRRVLHTALPLHYICLCIRPFALMPSTVFRERAPFSSEEEFRQFQELSPLHAHLAACPGTTFTRLSDLVSDGDLARTEFFRRFMLPHDDRYFACLNFWRDGIFQGLIGLHRTPGQRDFADSEMAFLESLHPHFNTVLQRILSLHRERAVRLSLEKLLVELPTATLLLDWDLHVAYRNRSAIDLCAVWNHGRERARLEKHAGDFALPTHALAYCAELKAAWQPSHHRCCALTTPESISFAHPEIAGLRASVALLQLDAAPLSMPMFLVRIEDKGPPPDHPAGSESTPLNQAIRLTQREREVAQLIGQGYSNEEVAGRLGKSVLTVKKQLGSIYLKLSIHGRGRLIALMR